MISFNMFRSKEYFEEFCLNLWEQWSEDNCAEITEEDFLVNSVTEKIEFSNNGKKFNFSLLYAAIYSGDIDVVHELQSKCSMNEAVRDKGGFKALLNSKDSAGKTMLAIAAFYDHDNVAVELIRLGASLDEGDFDGNTPLGIAHNKSSRKVEELLLENGCSDVVICGSPAAKYSPQKHISFLFEDAACEDFESKTPITCDENSYFAEDSAFPDGDAFPEWDRSLSGYALSIVIVET